MANICKTLEGERIEESATMKHQYDTWVWAGMIFVLFSVLQDIID